MERFLRKLRTFLLVIIEFSFEEILALYCKTVTNLNYNMSGIEITNFIIYWSYSQILVRDVCFFQFPT